MTFWGFANNHEIVTLFCVLALVSCVATSIKHIARACGGRGAGKLASGAPRTKMPAVESKAAGKAH
jgi:hypothetical protein